MSAKKAARPSPILMLAPAALVLLAYNYFFHFPQQRQLSEVRGRLEKLEAGAADTRHQYGHVMADLASLKKEQAELAPQLTAAQTRQAELQHRRSLACDEVNCSVHPANTMDTVTQLLERYQLAIIDSQPQGTGRTPATHAVLKPLVELLGGNAGEGAARQTYRIRLQGRFADVQQALRELIERVPAALPLSVEMEPSDQQMDRRTWILTLLV